MRKKSSDRKKKPISSKGSEGYFEEIQKRGNQKGSKPSLSDQDLANVGGQ